MRIGIVNRSDLNGGAAVAAMRLFEKLKDSNIAVKYLVGIKHNDNESTLFHYKSELYTKLRNHFEKLLLNKRNGKFPFSINLTFFPLKYLLKYHKINIVHLHWIGAGFISINSLKSINKPIVWTMHDSWTFTGGCHLPHSCASFKSDCGNCPEINSHKNFDLSRFLLNRKKSVYNRIANITFVSPSKWLANQAVKSSILHGKKILVIPNGLDTDLFSPKNKSESRNLLNIKSNAKIVLFGSFYSTTDENKGYKHLISALNILNGLDFEIIVFGSDRNEQVDLVGKKTHFTGRIYDENLMAALYSAADVTIVPSHSENLSYVIMESLACGTPVVAYNVGGNSELVEHKINGYLAISQNFEDLASGIKWVLYESNYKQLQSNARQKIITNFDISMVSEKYIDVYKSLLNV